MSLVPAGSAPRSLALGDAVAIEPALLAAARLRHLILMHDEVHRGRVAHGSRASNAHTAAAPVLEWSARRCFAEGLVACYA